MTGVCEVIKQLQVLKQKKKTLSYLSVQLIYRNMFFRVQYHKHKSDNYKIMPLNV